MCEIGAKVAPIEILNITQLLQCVCLRSKLFAKRSFANGRKKKIVEIAVELNYMSERQREISLVLASLWGYMSDTPSTSKQVSAVLPQGEEVRRYKNKTIKKRPDGRYWARYYKDGKQCCVYGRTVDECLSALKQALSGKPKKQKEPSKQMTLAEWLEKWLELYKKPKLQETTIAKLRYSIKSMQPLLNVPLKKLTSIAIQDFLNGIEGSRKREIIYINLKDALTKAVKNKLIADNPFDAVEIKREKRAEKRALTVDEERALVTACKGCKEGLLFLLCLYQGLRIGEALALTYDDIDFDKRTITISKSLTERNQVKCTKNGEDRVVPLFKQTAKLLDRTATGKVCIYSRPVYQRKIAELCRELNIKGISTHSLRHTFATRCAESGVAAKTVQLWLGHKTLEMTLNVYTHVNADFEKKETVKIDTYFDTQNF